VIRTLFRRPTPSELLARQLAEAELYAIRAVAEAEQHTAYVEMLRKRIARLRKDLAEAAAQEKRP